MSAGTGGNLNTGSIGAVDEALSERTVGLSNDVIVVRERFQPFSIKFFDVLNGNSIGDSKITHSVIILLNKILKL